LTHKKTKQLHIKFWTINSSFLHVKAAS